jgi:hypothetical protein
MRVHRPFAAFAALAVIGGGAAEAAAPPPMCDVVLVSPAYQRDRTMVCVHPDSQAARVLAVSTNAGRTWRDPAMSGLVRPAGPSAIPMTVTFSPAFAEDRALFATTGSGTYVSTNLGATFTPVDALTKAGAIDNPVAFVGRMTSLPVGADSGPRVLLAYAGQLAALIDPAGGVRSPVVGVPGRGALRFVVFPSPSAPAGAVAVVNESDVPSGDHAAVYRCDAALTCAEPLFAFPAGIRFGLDSRLRLLPDRSLVALLVDGHGVPQVWRSTDGGATFTAWQSVHKLLPAGDGTAIPPTLAFAATAARPRRVYLRVETSMPSTGWRPGAPPASQLFRTDDAGVTWHRVAYARTLGQPGPRGTLPWQLGPGAGRQIQLTPDGRLLADGSAEALATTWCSLDGGLRWTAGCRR